MATDGVLRDLGNEDVELALAAVRHLREEVQRAEAVAVGRARSSGLSWQRIAVLLGRTRSSVWEKYSDDDRRSHR